MSRTPAGMVKRYTVGVKTPKMKAYARLGRHKRTGKFVWWGKPLGIILRRRGLLAGTITPGEIPALEAWMKEYRGGLFRHRKLTEIDPTPRVNGNEDNVHSALLTAVNRFMAAHAPRHRAHVLSGFRPYAKQLALWLAFRAGTGNPANRPGSSKHEATGGFKVARAIDLYIDGVAFWTWCDRKGLRDEAERYGLRQPYPHEPWHVEKAGL